MVGRRFENNETSSFPLIPISSFSVSGCSAGGALLWASLPLLEVFVGAFTGAFAEGFTAGFGKAFSGGFAGALVEALFGAFAGGALAGCGLGGISRSHGRPGGDLPLLKAGRIDPCEEQEREKVKLNI